MGLLSLEHRTQRPIHETGRNAVQLSICKAESAKQLSRSMASLRLPESPFPKPSPQSTPEVLPYLLLGRRSGTSQRRAARRSTVLRAAPAGGARGRTAAVAA
jgi:hypothetical protein